MEHGIVNRITTGMFRYQGWPTVCRDEKGVLYAVCSGGRIGHICPFGKTYLYFSYDEGKTWSCPNIVNDDYLDDRDGGILSLGNGKLLLSWFTHPADYYPTQEKESVERATDPITHDMTMGLLMDGWSKLNDEQNDYGSFLRLSENSGLTFGKTIRVPISSPHGPKKVSGGRLLYIGKEFHSQGQLEAGHVYCMESRDEGKHWEVLSALPLPEGCTWHNIHEPDVLELPDGTLIGAYRGCFAPVPFEFSTYILYSYDGGRSWTEPKNLGFNGAPPHLLRHSSGAVILSYGRRCEPFGACARISRDNGKTFGREIQLSDGKVGDLGYTSTAQLSDGSLISVYYQRYENDSKCSILYTKWRLEDEEAND